MAAAWRVQVSTSSPFLSHRTSTRQNRRARDRGSAARAASSSSVVSKLARIYFLQKSSGIITSAAVYTRHAQLLRAKAARSTAARSLAASSTATRSTASARHALLRHVLQPAALSTAACASLASCSACRGPARVRSIDVLDDGGTLNGGTLDGRGTAADGRWS